MESADEEKVKAIPCSCPEGTCRNGGIAPHILKFGTRWK